MHTQMPSATQLVCLFPDQEHYLGNITQEGNKLLLTEWKSAIKSTLLAVSQSSCQTSSALTNSHEFKALKGRNSQQ